MKNLKKILMCVLAFLAGTAASGAEKRLPVNTEKPTALKGKAEDRYVRMRSECLPAQPGKWYRCSAEIRVNTKKGPGRLRFRVRQVHKNGKSVCYSDIVQLGPQVLDYVKHSNVLFTKPDCHTLQVYLILDRLDGEVMIRNIALEEVSREEADAITAKMAVPPAFPGVPPYAYTGEKNLEFCYRSCKQLLKPEQVPAVIRVSSEKLGFRQEFPAQYDKMVTVKTVLKTRLKTGKYPVVMEALSKDGKVLVREERILRVFPKPEYEKNLPVKTTSIDKEGNLFINGKPVLLRGIYHVYKYGQMQKVANAGFNAVMAWSPKPETYLKFLDNLEKCDLYASCVLKLLKDDKLDALLNVIGNHPAVLFWDLVDEPAIRNITPDRVMPVAKQLRAKSNKLLRISFSDGTAVPLYRECIDAAANHNYVIPFAGAAVQAEKTRQMCAHFPYPRKHTVQMTLQSWINSHDISGRPQTVEETRAIAYLSLINGAKGLWWYAYTDSAALMPHVWSTFKGLNREISELSGWFLLGKREILDCGNKNAECASFRYNDRTVVIAVNTSDKVQKLTLKLPGKLQELYADDAVLSGNAGTVTVELAPLQTRLFNQI